MSSTRKEKRYNRKQRLQSAKKWIPTYNGKNLVRGYGKWYGVNYLCAVKELEILGYKVDKEYKNQLLMQEKAKMKANIEKKKRRKQEEEGNRFIESDSYFQYIVGYTSGGAPYGVTWEQYYADESEDMKEEFSDDDIPF